MKRLLAVVLLLSVPGISAAQTPSTTTALPKLPRVYLDVNLLGYGNPLGEAKTFEGYALKFGEVASFKATYPVLESSGGFPVHVGGGFMLNSFLAIEGSYSRMSRSALVNLSAAVPHPSLFNEFASDSGSTSSLSRTESAVHISLAYVPLRSDRVELRVIGGPTFFNLNADMVSEVEYDQIIRSVAPLNIVTINGGATREASGSAVGFHLGGDVTVFVHRLVGISGGIRYGQGTVAVNAEPLSNIRQEFLVGSTTVFLGLRFRVGRAY